MPNSKRHAMLCTRETKIICLQVAALIAWRGPHPLSQYMLSVLEGQHCNTSTMLGSGMVESTAHTTSVSPRFSAFAGAVRYTHDGCVGRKAMK